MRNWKKILLSASMAALMSITSIASYASPITNPGRSTKPESAKTTPSVPNQVSEQATARSDFYEYINAQWLKDAKIPEDRASISNFTIANDQVEASIKKMIADLNKNYDQLAEGSDEKKLVDFYNVALDFKTRDALGFKPVKPYTDKVNAVKSIDGFTTLAGELFMKGYATAAVASPSTDRKDSQMTVLYIGTPSTGLSKTTMESKDEFSVKQQNAYKTLLTELFELNGNSKEEAKKKAELVYGLEKEMVSAMLSPEKAQDHEAQYNVMTLEQLTKQAPNLGYDKLLKTTGLDIAKKIIVFEPAAIKKASDLFVEKNLPAIKAQMEAAILRNDAQYLSKDAIRVLVKYNSVSSGIDPTLPTDEELAYTITNKGFGELIGKLYVKQNFTPETKKDVEDMTKDIIAQYRKRIGAVDWMSKETKEKALKKLDTMTIKIGYPDKWKDLSQITIKSVKQGGTVVENVHSVAALEMKELPGTLNKAPDKSKWSMDPHEINAYYNPQNNEIVFPAAILQKPFYDPKGTKEENLGGIGAVIGHEITHAFDANGSQFDEKGNLSNWWKEEDFKKFQVKVKQAADIYSAIEVAPGYHINGEISTGEIIADLGGMTVAIEIAKEKGYDTKKVFEAYAKVWRSKSTMESLIANLSDEHPPGKYRINNIVNLLDQFYKDFDVKEGDKMYVRPEDRLRVW